MLVRRSSRSRSRDAAWHFFTKWCRVWPATMLKYNLELKQRRPKNEVAKWMLFTAADVVLDHCWGHNVSAQECWTKNNDSPTTQERCQTWCTFLSFVCWEGEILALRRDAIVGGICWSLPTTCSLQGCCYVDFWLDGMHDPSVLLHFWALWEYKVWWKVASMHLVGPGCLWVLCEN